MAVADVEQGFMPWLMDRVCEEIQKSELGRLVVDGMIREIVAARSQAFQVSTALHNRMCPEPQTVVRKVQRRKASCQLLHLI